MEALTLSKAVELYEILGVHIPNAEKEIDPLDFIGKIVHNIRESKQHRDYVDAVMLVSGKTWEELKELEPDEVLDLFVEGLSVNRVISLKSFCDDMGYSYARSR